MATLQNPLGGLIDGILQGQNLRLQLRQAAMQEQAFRTKQALDNHNASVKQIMDDMAISQVAQRVNNGKVDEPTTTATVAGQMMGPSIQQTAGQDGSLTQSAGPATPSPIPAFQAPGVPGGPTAIDPSRTVEDLPNAQGNGSQQWALKTPQQLQTQADLVDLHNRMNKAQDIYSEDTAKGQAQSDMQLRALGNAHAFQLAQEGGGTPAPPEFAAFGYKPGTMLTRAELAGGTKELQDQQQAQAKLASEGRVTLKPGETLYQMPGAPGSAGAPPAPGTPPAAAGTPGAAPAANPGGLIPLASGGEPAPTGDFEKSFLPKFLMKAGKTPQNATVDDLIQAHQAYATATKDPATLELAHALTAARLAQMQDQNSGNVPDIQPGTAQYKVAQDLAYGKLTMQQFRTLYSYSRNINQKLALYNKASELNPNFNPANFEMGFNLAKNPKVQQQLASMDNVTQAVPDLVKFSDLAQRTGVPMLNGLVVKGGLNVGGKTYSDFHTAQIAFADELSGALGFGGATDMSRQMGFDMTNPNLSPEQFKSSVQNVVLPFIERKRETLLNQMGVYGQPGMNPGAGQGGGTPGAQGGTGGAPGATGTPAKAWAQTKTLADGRVVGWNPGDATWTDTKTGQPLVK